MNSSYYFNNYWTLSNFLEFLSTCCWHGKGNGFPDSIEVNSNIGWPSYSITPSGKACKLADQTKNLSHLVAYSLFNSTKSYGIGLYPKAEAVVLPEMEDSVLWLIIEGAGLNFFWVYPTSEALS